MSVAFYTCTMLPLSKVWNCGSSVGQTVQTLLKGVYIEVIGQFWGFLPFVKCGAGNIQQMRLMSTFLNESSFREAKTATGGRQKRSGHCRPFRVVIQSSRIVCTGLAPVMNAFGAFALPFSPRRRLATLARRTQRSDCQNNMGMNRHELVERPGQLSPERCMIFSRPYTPGDECAGETTLKTPRTLLISCEAARR
jgi:hypothetical protein